MMQPHSPESRSTEITVIAAIIALLVLLQPMLGWWGASDNPWYAPYLVWLGIIVLIFCLQRMLRKYAI